MKKKMQYFWFVPEYVDEDGNTFKYIEVVKPTVSEVDVAGKWKIFTASSTNKNAYPLLKSKRLVYKSDNYILRIDGVVQAN